MADLSQKIEVEYDNIQSIIDNLNKIGDLNNLSELELRGTASFVHNFYNGIEHILKLILKEKDIPLPDGSSWHRDLIFLSSSKFCLSETTKTNLNKFLSFRHFFVHNYYVNIDPDEIKPLIEIAENVFEDFKKEISAYLQV